MLDITITYNGLTVFRSHCLFASRQSLGHHYDTFGMVHMDIDRFISHQYFSCRNTAS
jgi:hypothetical protein